LVRFHVSMQQLDIGETDPENDFEDIQEVFWLKE
jgi:hypothetical protein